MDKGCKIVSNYTKVILYKTNFSGQHIGNNVIRGCFSSVFKYGDAPTTNVVGEFSFVIQTNHKNFAQLLDMESVPLYGFSFWI